jgi:hypothetical protein
MTTVESEAAFASRALSIGVELDVLEAIKIGGLDTFGKFAYSCAYTPGSSDEKPFKDLLVTVLGREPTVKELAVLRRLYFESHALSVADLRTRVEAREDDQPKKMAAPERTARLEAQRLALVGINISGHNEPANCLVDRCVQQLEDGQLRHIPLNECPSRMHEVLNQKKEPSITFDSGGSIRISRKEAEIKTDTSSELKIQQAMLRRSLAYDQAGLISFTTLSSWSTKLFDLLSVDPPTGYKRISMEQLLNADKELFMKTSEVVRANLTAAPGAPKPVDAAMMRLMDDPKVQYLLLPLPSLSGTSSSHTAGTAPATNRAAPYVTPPKPKGGGKDKGKDKGKGVPSIPDGCSGRDPKNRPICFGFNTGGCKYAKPGQRCKRGFHVCWKTGCGKHAPFSTCQH